MTPGSTVSNDKALPSSVKFASAVIVTLPVAKVKSTPEGKTLTSVLMLILPTFKVTCEPVTV